MIVCICSNINSSTITKLIEQGVVSPKQIHLATNNKIQCGKCIQTIKEMIHEQMDQQVSQPRIDCKHVE